MDRMSGSSGPLRARTHEQPIAADVRELRDRLARGADASLPPREPQADGLAAARAQRRELYVLAAVCAERVVEDFITATPPGQVPSLRGSPKSEASAAFSDALLETFGEFFKANPNRWRGGARPTRIEPLLARIDEIGPPSSGVLDRPRFHYAEHLLHAGMRSMAPIAPCVLSAIIELAARAGLSPTPAEVARIGRRSVRVASQLAAVDLGRSREAQRQLIDGRTLEFRVTDSTRLTTDPHRERLELDFEIPAAPGPAGRWPLPAAYSYAVGCPALVRGGAASPLERLWEWTVDAAERSGYLAARAA
jgi:hypothetical protein